ncbi:hypothetical protein [uncultured Serinicoccus sp.]|uniref:hypothetical protein n=1 Tax=uncultured Serinicoccus sp. TaxID=735514 RepID=UPI0026091407|nr:hypothetical protein [uncultured Serinicoccus sp.]
MEDARFGERAENAGYLATARSIPGTDKRSEGSAVNWTDELLEWTSRPPLGDYTLDCSVAAVNDKTNPVPVTDPRAARDFACCGDGFFSLWRDDYLWMAVPMVFSDRVRDGQTGLIESLGFLLDKNGALSVRFPWWVGKRAAIDVRYISEEGQFITALFDAPTGFWHVAISLDRRTTDPAFQR